jgi:hypothetical protein
LIHHLSLNKVLETPEGDSSKIQLGFSLRQVSLRLTKLLVDFGRVDLTLNIASFYLGSDIVTRSF